MIRLSHVRKAFGQVVAVDDLSLEVTAGEVLGLLGPNGAGKTTTVNMVVGLLVPEEGSVTIGGAGSPTDPAIRRRIGVAPQTVSLYGDLSGETNLAHFARLHGLGGQKLAERVAWALDFAGLTDRRADRVSTYSGGMQRRLNLAAALVHEPDLLLLDEPTVGVDPQSRSAILDKVRALSEEGRTIVYCTHYMEEAQRLCDRVAIMDYGKLLTVGKVSDLVAQHGGKSVVTGTFAGRDVRLETDDPVAALQQLQSQGSLLHFAVDRPDLESVFLALTGRHLRN
jgi:ABC-2 type transport system ATP-binding protein